MIRDKDGRGEAGETVQQGSTEGDSLVPERQSPNDFNHIHPNPPITREGEA